MSAYAWEALLLARCIALADPVKAYTCKVDVESGVVVLFADDPDRPVREDHQFAIDRLATADLTRSESVRRWWPFLRDRRIDYFEDLTKRYRK